MKLIFRRSIVAVALLLALALRPSAPALACSGYYLPISLSWTTALNHPVMYYGSGYSCKYQTRQFNYGYSAVNQYSAAWVGLQAGQYPCNYMRAQVLTGSFSLGNSAYIGTCGPCTPFQNPPSYSTITQTDAYGTVLLTYFEVASDFGTQLAEATWVGGTCGNL